MGAEAPRHVLKAWSGNPAGLIKLTLNMLWLTGFMREVCDGGGGWEEPFVGAAIQDQWNCDSQFRFETVVFSLACVLNLPPNLLLPACKEIDD